MSAEENKIRNLLTIANDEINTLLAVYLMNGTQNKYTFKVTKELADTLQIDDYVLVESRDTYAMVQVVEIHEDCEIRVGSKSRFKWAFAKVNLAPLVSLTAEENNALKMTLNSQRDRVRAQARDMLSDQFGLRYIPDLPDGVVMGSDDDLVEDIDFDD